MQLKWAQNRKNRFACVKSFGIFNGNKTTTATKKIETILYDKRTFEMRDASEVLPVLCFLDSFSILSPFFCSNHVHDLQSVFFPLLHSYMADFTYFDSFLVPFFFRRTHSYHAKFQRNAIKKNFYSVFMFKYLRF